MKKISILLFLFLFPGLIHAQSLFFCEGVDVEGNPVNESTEFTIPKGGGYIFFLFKADSVLNTTYIKFSIYEVVGYFDEVFDNDIFADTQKDWNYVWKQIAFYKAGFYKINVYNAKNEWLYSASLQVGTEK